MSKLANLEAEYESNFNQFHGIFERFKAKYGYYDLDYLDKIEVLRKFKAQKTPYYKRLTDKEKDLAKAIVTERSNKCVKSSNKKKKSGKKCLLSGSKEQS